MCNVKDVSSGVEPNKCELTRFSSSKSQCPSGLCLRGVAHQYFKWWFMVFCTKFIIVIGRRVRMIHYSVISSFRIPQELFFKVF